MQFLKFLIVGGVWMELIMFDGRLTFAIGYNSLYRLNN